MSDLLDDAERRFRALESYQTTLCSVGADGDRHEMRYSYCKPGWVRIDCITPHHGAVLIYDPGTRRVRLWSLGFGFFPPLNLAPDNPLVRSPRGHTVDRSDVGALLESVQAMRRGGSYVLLGTADISGETGVGFEVMGDAGSTQPGVHRNRVWLAQDALFPRRVESFDARGELVETVDLVDTALDVRFPERFFAP